MPAMLKTHPAPAEEGFFATPIDAHGAPAESERLLALLAALPAGVNLFIAEPPLAAKVADQTAQGLVAKLGSSRMALARQVLDFLLLVRHDVRTGDYFIEDLIATVEQAPAFTEFTPEHFTYLRSLTAKGAPIVDLAADAAAFQEALTALSRERNIALEYLLGNLNKAVRMLKRVGARAATVNLSGLFHNLRSGFYEIDVAAGSDTSAKSLRERSLVLRNRGVEVEIFYKGNLRRSIADIETVEFTELCAETDTQYDVAPGSFLRFAGAVVSEEERRTAEAPPFTVEDLLACFKFASSDQEVVALPPANHHDDPRAWNNTELGRALSALEKSLNWVTVSVGIKAAGDFEAQKTDRGLRDAVEKLRRLAHGSHVSLASGRTGRYAEPRVDEAKDADLLFDLYCHAVLEKKPLAKVIDAATGLLELIVRLENGDSVARLDALVSARLAGEPYAALLGSEGLIIRSTPIIAALEALRGLDAKAKLTIDGAQGGRVPIKEASIDDFRRTLIQLGRKLRPQLSPDRLLSIVIDKIVPEIRQLPVQVIAKGPHSVERILELAAAGIPARYPLRRPWDKIDLDRFINMGHNLEPGIRNCLGCPVNSLYGLVTKTAIGEGYNEIITYEATGCFEVYSGIWPYTGKKFPSIHGVFGGAPSEMLGGLAAKRSRVRHALKTGAPVPSNRVLHLGWGGDGATFDIGFGNLSGLYSRLQRLGTDDLEPEHLLQRALYVCYDNEGYQNTGNQYSAASAPGGNTTTNPQGRERPMGNELRKKPMVEIIAEHGVPISARMNIHRQEHISRVIARALADGDRGSFIHFLQPCTTGWKFTGDSLTYDLAAMSEEGGLFPPVTIEHGVAYLEHYPTPRNPKEAFLKMQARFKHLLGGGAQSKAQVQRVMDYYRDEWLRNLRLCGFDGEIPQSDRLAYLEEEHRIPRTV